MRLNCMCHSNMFTNANTVVITFRYSVRNSEYVGQASDSVQHTARSMIDNRDRSSFLVYTFST